MKRSAQMKRILALLFLLSSMALAQNTATITATLTNTGGPGVGSNAFLKFELYGCGGNRANWPGGTIVQPLTVYTDSSGIVTAAANGGVAPTVVRNDVITCGNVLGGTSYWIQPFVNGVPSGPRLQYQIASGSFNWNTAASLTVSVPPQAPLVAVVTQPTGVQTVSKFALSAILSVLPNRVTASATMAFDCNQGTYFITTLTLNVTAPTLVNCADGDIIVFEITQGAGGPWTFAFPADVLTPGVVGSGAGAVSNQVFIFNAVTAKARPWGPMTIS